ncbi:MAG: YjiH family protein [Clostridium sp.]|nr:YjiH family protein [Clostridium sp.]MDU7085068.1 YjiH family protein [Clostridium sp.]
MQHYVENENKSINIGNLMKFIIASSIGGFMFLVPIAYQGSVSTPIGILIDFVKGSLKAVLPYIVIGGLLSSTVLSILEYIIKPKFITESPFMMKVFATTPLYIITKVIATIIVAMVMFNAGPDAIISADTGGTMVSLGSTLVAIALSLSYILPLLTDCGIMEFLGVITKKIVRPLFKVPGRASVDLITSWFGASNAAVILSREQYMAGFYTAKETGIIMTNFSIVSIPFCFMIAGMLGIESLFPVFYLAISIVTLVLALVIPRIKPLKSLSDTYYKNNKNLLSEDVPEGKSMFTYALEQSCKRAEKFNVKDVIKSGNEIVVGMIFNLIPIVIAWGTIALILVEFTPIFTWISYPMGVVLNLLGVEGAFQVAPATLVGFADMFIPALLITGVESVKTKFIVGVLSLVQIIYMTEVGAIIIQSEVPIGFKELLIIFLERTIIALPIIVLIANIVF